MLLWLIYVNCNISSSSILLYDTITDAGLQNLSEMVSLKTLQFHILESLSRHYKHQRHERTKIEF